MKKKYMIVTAVAVLLSNGFARSASTGVMPVEAEERELGILLGSDTDEMSPEDEAQERILEDLETEYESIIPIQTINESNTGSEDLELLDLPEHLSDAGSDSGLESEGEFGDDEDEKFDDSVGVDIPGIDVSWISYVDVVALTDLVEFMTNAISQKSHLFSHDLASYDRAAQAVRIFRDKALPNGGLQGHKVFALAQALRTALQEFIGAIRPSGPSRVAARIQAAAKFAEMTDEFTDCQEELIDLQDEMGVLKRQLADVENDTVNRVYAQRALEKEFTSVQEQLRNAQSLIARVEKENSELRRDLKELKDND